MESLKSPVGVPLFGGRVRSLETKPALVQAFGSQVYVYNADSESVREARFTFARDSGFKDTAISEVWGSVLCK